MSLQVSSLLFRGTARNSPAVSQFSLTFHPFFPALFQSGKRLTLSSYDQPSCVFGWKWQEARCDWLHYMSRAVYKYLWRVVVALFQKPHSTTPFLRKQVQAFYSVPATFQPISFPSFFFKHTKARWPGPAPRLCWHARHTGGWQRGLLSSCVSFFFQSQCHATLAMAVGHVHIYPKLCACSCLFFTFSPWVVIRAVWRAALWSYTWDHGNAFRPPWALNAWWSVGSHIDSFQDSSISCCWSVADKCTDFFILDLRG